MKKRDADAIVRWHAAGILRAQLDQGWPDIAPQFGVRSEADAIDVAEAMSDLVAWLESDARRRGLEKSFAPASVPEDQPQ